MEMSTQVWHAGEPLLRAYLAGSLNALDGASVEQHVSRCSECRTLVGTLTDRAPLDRAWLELRTSIERTRLPLVVRAARRCGLREPHAVLLAASVSLRTAWLSSAFVALAFSLAATHAAADFQLWPFLLVAPLIPVLGVAAAYGHAEDPLETLIATSPFGRDRLILLRTAAVLVTCVPVACLLGLFLPGPPWVAVAWLGPALSLVPVLLALATFVEPRLAGAMVALVWSGFVLGSVRPFWPTWPVEASQQLAFLVVALLAIAVLALRSARPRQIGVRL
jgi:hypothetical protein